jgi:hypothetical protein
VLAAVAVWSLLGGAYYFTNEPAPEVRVIWRSGLEPAHREAIERRFGLVRARGGAGTALLYDLLDLRPDNVRELLQLPEVAGSGYLDETSFSVPWELPPGLGRTWIAEQLVVSPELREFHVIRVVLGASGALLAWAAAATGLALWRGLHRRLAAVTAARHRPSRQSAAATRRQT